MVPPLGIPQVRASPEPIVVSEILIYSSIKLKHGRSQRWLYDRPTCSVLRRSPRGQNASKEESGEKESEEKLHT